MTLRILRVSPVSLALTLGGVYFVFGCISALLGLFGSVTRPRLVVMDGPFGFETSLQGMPLLVLLLPFLSALVGGITGYVVAWVYNFLTRFTRGLVIETEEAGKYDRLF